MVSGIVWIWERVVLMVLRGMAARYRGSARAVGAAMLCAATVTACTSTLSGAGQGLTTPTGTSTLSPSSRGSSGPASQTSPGSLGRTLEQIALRSGELNQGYRLKLYEGGDQVAGQVTLDNCGYAFTSEADRVARRQYAVLDAAGNETGVSNELVAYDTAAHAAFALAQVHQAVATCPKTPVRSAVAGVPALTYRVTEDKHGVTALPSPMNLLVVESAAAQGQTLYNVSVYQVHGRYLDAVYFDLDAPASSADIKSALMLAGATGRRLVMAT